MALKFKTNIKMVHSCTATGEIPDIGDKIYFYNAFYGIFDSNYCNKCCIVTKGHIYNPSDMGEVISIERESYKVKTQGWDLFIIDFGSANEHWTFVKRIE